MISHDTESHVIDACLPTKLLQRVANGSKRGRACPAEVTGRHRHYITLPRAIRFQPLNARIRTLCLISYIA